MYKEQASLVSLIISIQTTHQRSPPAAVWPCQQEASCTGILSATLLECNHAGTLLSLPFALQKLLMADFSMRTNNKFCLKGPDNTSAQPSLHQHLQMKIPLKESTDPKALYERHSFGTEDCTKDVKNICTKECQKI